MTNTNNRETSNEARTLLARALLEAGASKLEAIELIVSQVQRAFPELSSEDHKALAWRFFKDLTVAAQELEAGATK